MKRRWTEEELIERWTLLDRLQRVAIYLRVSTDDQHSENQLLQLREFCERWEGHELVAEYVDKESGTRGRRERKDFDRMFADAAGRRFDVLLFWALDRFSREGIRKTIASTCRGWMIAGWPSKATRSRSLTPTTNLLPT